MYRMDINVCIENSFSAKYNVKYNSYVGFLYLIFIGWYIEIYYIVNFKALFGNVFV